MKTNETKDKQVSVRFDSNTFKKLQDRAKKEKKGVAEILREALGHHLGIPSSNTKLCELEQQLAVTEEVLKEQQKLISENEQRLIKIKDQVSILTAVLQEQYNEQIQAKDGGASEPS